MLQSSGFTTFYQDAPNQCLFEVKTKDPRLNLGLVSFISTFELESDLDSNYATGSNEFEIEFSLPSHQFNDFAAPANKLNVLPEKMDFSELLSFQSETRLQPREPSIKEVCPPVDVMQMQSQLISMPEEQQKTDESTEILAVDTTASQPVLQSKWTLCSELFKNNSHTFVQNAKQKESNRKLLDAKGNISMDYLKVIKKEMQGDWPGAVVQGSILTSYYKAKEEENKKLHPPLAETISNFCQRLSNKNVSEVAKKEAPIVNFSIIKTNLANKINNLVDPMETEKKLVQNLECDKKIVKQKTPIILEANEIQENGVQIFRKPTKLFTFDNLKEWKKKGEGQIEIWKMQQSDDDIYYMLLWDKCTQKLLIHMRLDSKWSIDYLTNSKNSCRWSHYNYAQGPEGMRERFACRFRDSSVAAEFINIVGKCTANAN